MGRRLMVLLSFFALSLLSPHSLAQVPQIINYQGRIAVGTPPVNFDGTGSFKFALVNADGTTTYWSNDPSVAVSLAVTKGLYSVLLGDTSLPNMAAIPPSVFINSDVFLRVWFNDGTNGSQQFTPDQRIAAVGYAMMAGGLQSGTNMVQVGVTNKWIKEGYLTNGAQDAKLIMFGDRTTLGNEPYVSIGENTDDDQLELTASTMVFKNIDDDGELGVHVNGTLTAQKLIGDGSGLTNIPASAVIGGGAGGGSQSAAPAGMVLVPSGSFDMGNISGDTDGNITSANNPAVPTYVSVFFMDATEITLAQWKSVQAWGLGVGGYTDLSTGAAGRTNAGTNASQVPVVGVNWYDAAKWCNARSERDGKTPAYYTDTNLSLVYRSGSNDLTSANVNWSANGYRLPTEAEWERAARGGTNTRFPWGDTISQKSANYSANTTSNTNSSGTSYDLGPQIYNALANTSASPTTLYTTPVGTFAPNRYGLYDVAGNVQEWVWDFYGPPPYGGGSDPSGTNSGTTRVLRGGQWGFTTGVLSNVTTTPFVRCAARVTLTPTTTNNYTGFRTIQPVR